MSVEQAPAVNDCLTICTCLSHFKENEQDQNGPISQDLVILSFNFLNGHRLQFYEPRQEWSKYV